MIIEIVLKTNHNMELTWMTELNGYHSEKSMVT